MRYSPSDKTEIIGLVEQSHLPARRTLEKLGVPRSSTAGMIGISAADQKPSRIAPHGPIGSGTVSQRLSAARLSTWRWIWPAAGFVDTEKGCLLKLEVAHGKASVCARI